MGKVYTSACPFVHNCSRLTLRFQVTQLVFALVAPGNMTSNLMAAAISGAGASQAGDMMQVQLLEMCPVAFIH
jgi:hypothetical protein